MDIFKSIVSIGCDRGVHRENVMREKGMLPEEKMFEKEGDTLMQDDMAKGLMQLICGAINEWAFQYQLDNLPPKIVFQQALTIMTAMNKILYCGMQGE